MILYGSVLKPKRFVLSRILYMWVPMWVYVCMGMGIPVDSLDSIFERFYSERPESESFGRHSGLGLSISRQIIEAHGGTIHAENIQGGRGQRLGARFVVRLPAVDA